MNTGTFGLHSRCKSWKGKTRTKVNELFSERCFWEGCIVSRGWRCLCVLVRGSHWQCAPSRTLLKRGNINTSCVFEWIFHLSESLFTSMTDSSAWLSFTSSTHLPSFGLIWSVEALAQFDKCYHIYMHYTELGRFPTQKKKISLEKATMQKSSDSVRACKFILYKACDSSGGDFLHLKTDCKRNKQHYRAACERAYYWCDKPPEQIRLTVNEMVFWAWTRDEWA